MLTSGRDIFTRGRYVFTSGLYFFTSGRDVFRGLYFSISFTLHHSPFTIYMVDLTGKDPTLVTLPTPTLGVTSVTMTNRQVYPCS